MSNEGLSITVVCCVISAGLSLIGYFTGWTTDGKVAVTLLHIPLVSIVLCVWISEKRKDGRKGDKE